MVGCTVLIMNCLLCLYSASLPVDVLSSVSASHALLSRRSSRHYYPRSQPESSRHSGAVAQLVPTLLPLVTARIQSALRPCHTACPDIATIGHSQCPVSTQALLRSSSPHCCPRSQPESSEHSGPVTQLIPTLLPRSQPESSQHSGPAARGLRCRTPDRW